MRELIERLEAAAEGSRELDLIIARRVGWRDDSRYNDGGDAHMKFAEEHFSDGTGTGPAVCDDIGIPHYTESLDAALPWEEIVRMQRIMSDDGCWYECQQAGSFTGKHASEAIARRIAALRARED